MVRSTSWFRRSTSKSTAALSARRTEIQRSSCLSALSFGTSTSRMVSSVPPRPSSSKVKVSLFSAQYVTAKECGGDFSMTLEGRVSPFENRNSMPSSYSPTTLADSAQNFARPSAVDSMAWTFAGGEARWRRHSSVRTAVVMRRRRGLRYSSVPSSRDLLRVPPGLVEQEVALDERHVAGPHVPCRQCRLQIIEEGLALHRPPALEEEVPAGVIGEVDVPDAREVRVGQGVIPVLPEPADAPEPPVRQGEHVLGREPVDLLSLEEASEDPVRLLPRALRLRLDHREVRVPHLPRHLLDVQGLRLVVVEGLEHPLDLLPAELAPEHLQAAGEPHVHRLLQLLNPGVPALEDARHRNRLHELLPGREVVGLLGEPHEGHAHRHRPVVEVVLHLQLVLPDAVDERHEHSAVHDRLELDVEGVEDVLPRLHGEELLHRLRPHLPPVPAAVVPGRIERQDAGHLVVVAELLDADALLAEGDGLERVPVLVRVVDRLDEVAVDAALGVVELLVHHAVLLDRAELRARLRAHDL